MSEEIISKSKQKRLDQAKARAEQKRKNAMNTIMGVGIVLVILIVLVAVTIGRTIYDKATALDYSKYLNEDGTIDININDYCTTTYENMSFSKSELMPSDDEINSLIESSLNTYATSESDAALTAADGDRVTISYTNSIDGMVYNQILEEEGGTTYTIGSNSIDATFDNALIGHHPGDEFTVDVVYAADYADATLAGKTVNYEVKLMGVYVVPEFDDAFVTEHFSDVATTAEGYRQHLIDENYEGNLRQAVTDSISANCVILDYPENYLKNTERVIRQSDIEQFEYYKEMYAQYGLTLNNIWEMYGLTTEDEYDAQVTMMATESVEDALYYQAVYTKAGLTNTREDVMAYFTDFGIDQATFDEYCNTYGYPYLANSALTNNVIQYIMDNVTITE